MADVSLTIFADRAYSEVTDGIDTLLIAGAPDVNSKVPGRTNPAFFSSCDLFIFIWSPIDETFELNAQSLLVGNRSHYGFAINWFKGDFLVQQRSVVCLILPICD